MCFSTVYAELESPALQYLSQLHSLNEWHSPVIAQTF